MYGKRENVISDGSNGIPKRHHRGVSHIVHLSVAEAGFDSMHVEQVQLSLMPAGGRTPAADQSKVLLEAGAIDELVSFVF